MSFVRDDLNAICNRLTATLREIEDRIAAAPPSIALPGRGHDVVELSEATMAADKMRYAAHFLGQKQPGASAAL